jgi:thiol-disulfide isomerase/thioredoxin
LKDLIDHNRYTVLNFGSYTCPPFRTELEKYNTLYDKYKNIADFKVVYIEEAHAAGEWDKVAKPMSGTCYLQPKSIKARGRITADMLENEGKMLKNRIPIFIDSMDNKCVEIFQAKPERLYVIKDGKIMFRGGRGPFNYNLTALDEYLSTVQQN